MTYVHNNPPTQQKHSLVVLVLTRPVGHQLLALKHYHRRRNTPQKGGKQLTKIINPNTLISICDPPGAGNSSSSVFVCSGGVRRGTEGGRVGNIGGVARFAPLHQRALREEGFQVRSGSVQDGLGGRDPHHVRAQLVPLAEDADNLDIAEFTIDREQRVQKQVGWWLGVGSSTLGCIWLETCAYYSRRVA